MKIENHRLMHDDGTSCQFVPSPNMGDSLKHKYLIMHFTAGQSQHESVEWLSSRQAKASAHLVIGRDGGVTQLVPFDRIAWHAGASSWEGIEGLNKYSIGIELDNAGRLTRKGEHWRAWFGADYDNSQVIEAVHKFESQTCGWHAYTAEQISSALKVGGLLMEHYGLLNVVGHEDIAPHRKCDPGPAFPMASFRARLLGRAEDEATLYQTTTALNIRTGPGAQHSLLPGSPLAARTPVRFIAAQGHWWKVDVQGSAASIVDMDGWVNSQYLSRVG